MSGSEPRAAAGETIFRDVNERVAEIDRAHGLPSEELATFLCECGDSACLDRVALSVSAYDAVRASPTRFVLIPGHQDDSIERVVERHEHYLVVEKTGAAAELARERDPRRG